MNILMTGSSGLVGSELVPYLRNQGYKVIRLVRSTPSDSDERFWDPASGRLNPDELSGVDAIINLAGVNVASGRWTAARKRAIRESRLNSLRTLGKAIRLCPERPSIVISASAAGIYGDCGDVWLNEQTEPGTGFLGNVCREWETQLSVFKDMGVRTVALRLGLVLSPKGGALGKMLPFFRCGLGGRLGTGKQWMSWIAPNDLHRIIVQALGDDSWRGAINTVSPHPVTNRDFTKQLAGVLRRPAWFPVPEVVLRGVFGEMAKETLLASARLKPEFLQTHGFEFSEPDLEQTLRTILNKTSP